MKIDLPVSAPKDIVQGWEGQFKVFSWYHFITNVPKNIFLVTTLKENGKANIQLNAWGMLLGSGDEPKFVMQIMKNSDTYRLIDKNKEFVINIPAYDIKDKLLSAAVHYSDDTDEITASGFTHEESKYVKVPRVKECFSHYECILDWMKDVETDKVVNVLVQGSIVNAVIDDTVLGNSIKEMHESCSLVYRCTEFYNHAEKRFTQDGVFCRLNTQDM
ncbi:MAG: flavin reductase family protein [Bacillota bacterium]